MVSDKKFGIFFSIISFLITLLLCYSFEISWVTYLFIFLTIFFISLTIFRPIWLYQLKIGWYKLGITIGLFVTPIIFGVFYYVIFTPFGLIARFLNKNNDYNFKKKNDTYWNKLKNKNNNFKRQF